MPIFNDAGGLDIFHTFWDILMCNWAMGYKQFTLGSTVQTERDVSLDNSHGNTGFLFARILYLNT